MNKRTYIRDNILNKLRCLSEFTVNLDDLFRNDCFIFLDFKPASVMDIRYDETENAAASMGDRSKSVPGLNIVSFLF